MTSRAKFGGAGYDRGSWLAPLFMLLAVLAPTAYLLWFMNEAAANQRDVARQKLAEAYRGQLALVRDRLDGFWEKRAAELDRLPTFEACVREGLADSAILLNRDGSLAYPTPPAAPVPDALDSRPAWVEARALESQSRWQTAAAAYGRIAGAEQDLSLAARAAQAEVRCLMQGGDRAAAARAIERQFSGARFARALDPQGRLIAADEQLLALHLGRGAAAVRLQALVTDYSSPMPSAQRLFLMEEMRALRPGVSLPTYDAERLAAAFLDADRARPTDPVLRLSGLRDVWKLGSASGRVIALYRSATLVSAIPDGASFTITPPGAPVKPSDEWMPAGQRLPGWHVVLHNRGPLDDRRPVAPYVWVGFLVIATMAVLAIVAGQAFRRQVRLARLKTDLVATVSHELKTPLSSMRLLVDALLEDRDFDPRKTREYLELVARENTRLSRLIDNFLAFSRMERNRHRFEFAQTSAEEVLRDVVEAAGERFQQCHLQVEAAAGLPPFRADRDALVTVLLNLLDNAYKFTPSEKRIGLRAFCESGQVQFAVTDNGIGIPARERKKIFRRFYQVDRKLARQAGGCGLGLSIVEFIVQAHGGAIEVQSKPGAGSTFTVSLP